MTKLITAEVLKQMTLDNYQRKYNTISPDKINVSWGNSLRETKGRLDCQILFLNINGIQQTNDFEKMFEIGEELVYNDVDMTCLAKTKINWHRQKTKCSCECIAKRYHNQAKFITSSAIPDNINRIYQPGGTATIIGDPYMGRICKIETDNKYGRWTKVTFQGKSDKKVTIITAYQVNKDTVNTADDRSTWKQQYNIMRQEGIQNPDPRKRFWEDLENEIKKLQHDK